MDENNILAARKPADATPPTPIRCSRCGEFAKIAWVECSECARPELSGRVAELEAQLASPIDVLLFCPNCGEQHIDGAKPEVCETCGNGESECSCGAYTPWLNPPHKSHRCNYCNHVWRPADAPTNGVAKIQSGGRHDGDPQPRWNMSALEAQLAEAKAENEALQYEAGDKCLQLAEANARAEAADSVNGQLQGLIKTAREQLNNLLVDEDLDDKKLRDASEGLLPNIVDRFTAALARKSAIADEREDGMEKLSDGRR